jgi:hypothetical protein
MLADIGSTAMNGSNPWALFAGAFYLLPALVWGILAHSAWRFLLTKRPASWFFRLLPIMTSIITVVYTCHAVFTLLPADVQRAPGPLLIAAYGLSNLAHVALGA